MELRLDDRKQIVDTMIGVCLGYLVSEGQVQRQDIEGKWYSRCDMDDRLDSAGFHGGASVDDLGRPVIVFHSRQTFETLSHVLPHESVHLTQLCRGDWKPFQGYSLWKGQKFPHLKGDDPDYSSQDKQPWEYEAKQWEQRVRKALVEKFPTLENS